MDNTALAIVTADMVDLNEDCVSRLAAWAKENEPYLDSSEGMNLLLEVATIMEANVSLIKNLAESSMEVYDRLNDLASRSEQGS